MKNPELGRNINVLRNTLHALSLLYNNNQDEKWNFNNLTKMIEIEDPEIKQNKIGKYLKINIKNDYDIDYVTEKGSNHGELETDIDEKQLKELLNMYSTFVVNDIEKNLILDRLIKFNPYDSLWILARLHFAILNKQVIKFDYVKNDTLDAKHYKILPYYMVIKNNNLYLIGKDLNEEIEKTYILHRLKNLKVTEKVIENVQIPPVDEYYKNVLGSYFDEKEFKVTLKFKISFQEKLEEIIDILEKEKPKIFDKNYKTVVVSIADIKYLCAKLFLYEDMVEIIEPKEARDVMIQLIKKSYSIYLK